MPADPWVVMEKKKPESMHCPNQRPLGMLHIDVMHFLVGVKTAFSKAVCPKHLARGDLQAELHCGVRRQEERISKVLSADPGLNSFVGKCQIMNVLSKNTRGEIRQKSGYLWLGLYHGTSSEIRNGSGKKMGTSVNTPVQLDLLHLHEMSLC